jgi:sirohydrochlorin cobaltochelatase
MGAADLCYNDDGSVAWDEMWTNFCDLALAGGPSHRGMLLEPVTPDAVAADPEGYQQVITELTHGIQLVTGLAVVESRSPGWIGVDCAHEEMALWMLRAIVVEDAGPAPAARPCCLSSKS